MTERNPVTAVLQALVRLGHAPRASGNGWSARCPVHDDRVASLSISEGEDGRALICCHAGCNTEAVVHALGLEAKDLFAEPGQVSQRETRYSIRDTDGRVHAVHVRVDHPDGTKQMFWRRPDGASGLGGVPVATLPLYSSEKIREWDEGDVIVVVEGEKAADALTRAGFRALGTVTGAAGCPSPEVFAPLRGRSVVLWPDHDCPGRDHMVKLARRLMFIAGSVRVYEWSAGSKGADAYDYLAQDASAVDRLRSDLATAVPATDWLAVRVAPRGQRDDATGSSAKVDTRVEFIVAGALGDLPESPTRDVVVKALGVLGKLAQDLHPTVKVAVRFEAIDILKRIGVGPDEARRLVTAQFRESDDAGERRPSDQGTSLLFADVEPWPEPVDGAELLDELTRTAERYLSLPPGAAETLALWVVETHAHDAADISPILGLISPEKRCGKTTTLHLLTGLAPKPLSAANISSAALFRAVDLYHPTLLVDEADTFLKDREDLVGILNSGHARASAHVVRTVGEGFEPRVFSTWAPKAIALIGELPPTLEDRAVVITLQRRRPEHRLDRLRLDRLGEFEELRQKAARFAADVFDALREADPEVPEELHDRAADNWRPLFAIADAAGGRWPRVARECALLASGATSEGDSSPGIQLLGDVGRIFEDERVVRLGSAEIVAGLVAMEDRAWAEWRHGKAITQVQLARLLRPFKVRPHKVRIGDATQQGYRLADFEDAFGRYIPSKVEQVEHRKSDNDLAVSQTRNIGPPVPGAIRAVTPCEIRLVPGVPPRGVSPGTGVVCHIARGR